MNTMVRNVNIEKLVKVLEELDWTIYFSEDHLDEAYISQSSPLGEDFGFNISFTNEQEFREEIKDYYYDFDPEEHAAMWWENRNNTSGVPNSLRMLLEDADEIKRSLLALVDAINKVEFK